MEKQRTYIAIDLKSFYASVECVERGLDPLKANLVVADASRTEKTICLAVSPSLKAYGIPGRARLFEVVQKVKQVNRERLRRAPGHRFTGKSCDADELNANPGLELDYHIAPPQMAHYMKRSTEVYSVYLKYIAPDDIHVYSIDEVFMDVTPYLSHYGMTPRQLAMTMIQDVLQTTGITATAGIGTNLFLCKVAMDIVAKHIPADKDGVRIAQLDEMSYRRQLWEHRPLTDFWQVGRGYAKKLEAMGLFTMGDIARASLAPQRAYVCADTLYRTFGVNAELLIDHAWGWEPTTIARIKAYRPKSSSMGAGQVLHCPYEYELGRLIVREMTDLLVLDLVEKGLVTDQIVLTVGYDIANLTDPERRKRYRGPVTTDFYGRQVPKHGHGSANLGQHTSSTRLIMQAMMQLYDRVVNPHLLIRRVNIAANHVIPEGTQPAKAPVEQLDLFTDYRKLEQEAAEEKVLLEKERKLQEAELAIRRKFGKNAILKGMNLQEGATTLERNRTIGGHKA